jgi:biopolymer transport protein ExbB
MRTVTYLLKRNYHIVWTAFLFATAAVLWGADTNTTAAAASGHSAMYSVYDLIFHKGGLFMWPITALGFVSIYLVVDGFLVVRRTKAAPVEVINLLKEAIRQKKYDDVEKICGEYNCMLTRVFLPGFITRHRGMAAVEETLAEHGAREGMGVRAHISYLNTISVIEPMLGLLGTVSGMIKAFANVGAVGMGKTSELSNNIAEALITTYGGLVVAIPVFSVYMHLRNKVNDLVVHVQDDVGVLFDELQAVEGKEDK